MTERKPDTDQEWLDPDDAPEWTDEMFEIGELSIGDKVSDRHEGLSDPTG
jgi:hypothetical protein